MRLRIPARRIVLFGALLALALLVFLPLRLVLGWAGGGLTAREVSGPVWSASLKEARIGRAALGDLRARLAFLPLLIGQARLEASRESGAADGFTGAFGVSARTRFAESVSGIIPVDALFAPLPIASLELTGVSVRFHDGQCDRAEGLVRASLAGDMRDLALPASLSGAARCDRGALLLPLASGSGAEGLALRIFGDGRYEAEVRVRGTDPAIVERLSGAGFTAGSDGLVMRFNGRF